MNKKGRAARRLLSPRIQVLFLLAVPAVVLLLPLRLLAHPLPRAIGFLLTLYILLCLFLRLPQILRRYRALRAPNAQKAWVRLTVLGGLLLNLPYAAFRLWAGIKTSSLWFCAEGAYYVLLGIIRAFLVESDQRPRDAVRQYRQGATMLALLSLAMLGIVALAVGEERPRPFSDLIVWGSLLFAIWRVTSAVYYLLRFRHEHAPFLLCAKALSLCAAALSLFALQGTLLSRFSASDGTRDLWNILTGSAALLVTLTMALILFRKAKTHR